MGVQNSKLLPRECLGNTEGGERGLARWDAVLPHHCGIGATGCKNHEGGQLPDLFSRVVVFCRELFSF